MSETAQDDGETHYFTSTNLDWKEKNRKCSLSCAQGLLSLRYESLPFRDKNYADTPLVLFALHPSPGRER